MTADVDRLEEVAVLGAMLLWGGEAWPDEVLSLRPEHFESPRHGQIYQSMAELIEENTLVDEVSVAARLKEYGTSAVFPYLNELAAECPTTVNLEHWARLLLEQGRRRLIQKELDLAKASGASASDLAVRLRHAIDRIENDTVSYAGLDPIKDHVAAEIRELEQEASDPALIAVKTGIPIMDRNTGFRVGQMTIIAGRPGMGKSALAGTVAAYTASRPDSAVAVFSLEMSRSDIIRRLLAAEGGVDGGSLRELAARGELVEAAAKVHELDLWIDDRSRLTVAEIRRTLHRRCPRARLLVIDYLQLANMEMGEERHDLRVGATTKGLRAIAKDFGCHVVVLSQLNRAVEKRSPPEPQLSDLRDSGNIEEDADHVWLLYRPHYYDRDPDPTKATINIAKQRNGVTGRIPVKFVASQGLFTERTA